MSPELRRLIEREMALLRLLLDEHRSTIDAALREPPTLIEREALATMLRSFYTGIESIVRPAKAMRRWRCGGRWRCERAPLRFAPGRG